MVGCFSTLNIDYYFSSLLKNDPTDQIKQSVNTQRALVHDGDDLMAWEPEQVRSECMSVLKGHRLCIVCLMAFKGLMLHKHSAPPPPKKHEMRESEPKHKERGLRNCKKEDDGARNANEDTGRRRLWTSPIYEFLNMCCMGPMYVCAHMYIEINVTSHTLSYNR